MRSSPRIGKFIIDWFFSLKKLFLEKRLTWMIKYLGSRLIAYFYLTVYSVPSGLRRVSSRKVTPSYFFRSVMRET